MDISLTDLDVSLDLDVNLSDDLIDFSQVDTDIEIKTDNKYIHKKETISYVLENGYPIQYDKQTTGYYCAIRKTKVDPILEVDVDEKFAFKFKYQWDPYTGVRTIVDPHGPLYFDPDSIIRYFYSVRLNNLWNPPVGEYEGYYGDAVGNGPDFHIKGRGTFPDYNIFRLPIIDCYLTNDHNKQFVTLGPILTEDEIKEIASLANKKDSIRGTDSYRVCFQKSRPDLLLMKKLWDIATNPTPYIPGLDVSSMSQQELAIIYDKTNKEAVNSLRKMIG